VGDAVEAAIQVVGAYVDFSGFWNLDVIVPHRVPKQYHTQLLTQSPAKKSLITCLSLEVKDLLLSSQTSSLHLLGSG
jgi:hypothetical protein